MRYLHRYLLIALLFHCSASFIVAAELCPTHVVRPGETLESIATKLNLDKGMLIIAIEGCGQPAALLAAGDTICLPGSELPGCPNVKDFNNNANCKYYVLQAGESIATIALALNLYQPDVEAVNPDIVQGNLQVDDLIRLPGWNEEKCGILPTNVEQFAMLPSPPPPKQQGNPPKTDGNSSSKIPSPSPKPTTVEAPPAQGDAQKCRGFRARDLDDLFSIASLFAIDAAQLVAVNPDLGGGIPVAPGVVVKIPPYDPTCAAPVLIDAETLLAPPPMTGMDFPPGMALRPVNENAPPAEGPAPAEKTTAPAEVPGAVDPQDPAGGRFIEAEVMLPTETTTDIDENRSTSGPDLGFGGADTIEADDTTLQNIVKDGGNSNAPPPPKSGSNTGNIIMGVTIFVVCVALIGMLGMAFSGTAPMRLGMKKEAAPPDSYIV